MDGAFLYGRECSHPQMCIWAANDRNIFIMMHQSGLYTLQPSSSPQSDSMEHIQSVTLGGKRDADGARVRFSFNRIYDQTSRENAMDLYAILGVPVDSSTADIKKAYRRLSVEYHPDQNKGDPSAQIRFNQITKANEILSDPTKRMLYDTGGIESIRAMEKGEIQRGQDVLMEVNVPLQILFTGGAVNPNYRRRIVCTACRANPGLDHCRGCSRCPAEIRMVNQQVAPGFFVQQQVQVESKELCKIEDKPMEISIEKGASSGDQIVMERMGEQRPGMIPGNVIVRIKQINDSRFRRDGNDLHTSVTVGLKEGLLGFHKDIVHLDGNLVSVNRDGVTQPMQVIKIEEEGMPFKSDSDRRGHMYVTVVVEFPSKLTEDQAKLVSQMFTGISKSKSQDDEL
jgi:DnaJ-class molecular chaperone